MAPAPPLPERLGKYPITGLIGQGAMGVVYKGFDPVIQRPVAIKTVHTALLGDDPSSASMAARFRNEAQAVGRLMHPGIVAIYEYGEDGQTAFIAMEYVEGRNLDQLLATKPRFSEGQALRVMEQLLDALTCAHRHGVWHRDIKPANLILTAAGQVKLTDFGIARIEHAGLTLVNSMIGTPGYMAPEQYTGEGIDHRADLFACGVLLYRLLTGVAPFTGSPETLMYKVMNVEPQPPSQIEGAALPASYDAVVARAMAKQPAARYESAAAFRQALANRFVPASVATADLAALSDATIVLPASKWPVGPPSGGTVPAAGLAHPPTSAPPGTTTASPTSLPPPTGWDSATLTRIELALASVVGPVARLMVRQAARQTQDLAGLTADVARQIDGERERAQFLARVAPAAGTPPPRGSMVSSAGVAGTAAPLATHAMASATGQVAGVAHPLTEEVKARALAVLTRHMGPIAKIVVKRAAAQTHSSEPFWLLLAEAADGTDRERLLTELRRPL